MRHIAGLLLMLGVAACGRFASAADPPAEISPARADEHGFVTHTIESAYQAGKTEVRVLPPDELEPDRRYPVLYVLPVEAGRGDRYGDGLAECKKRNLHNEHGLICVSPTFSHLPWYADHPTDPHIRQETYFLEVVVPLVDEAYPVLAEPEGRLLVGFSKSGWGAFSLLLRHPAAFGRAAAWDAPLMMERPDKYGMGPIFGTQENFEMYRLSELLKQNAAKLGGNPRLAHLGYANFRGHHQAAHALMTELDVAHRCRDGPKRKHTWHSGWLPEAVEMLLRDGP